MKEDNKLMVYHKLELSNGLVTITQFLFSQKGKLNLNIKSDHKGVYNKSRLNCDLCGTSLVSKEVTKYTSGEFMKILNLIVILVGKHLLSKDISSPTRKSKSTET